MIAFVRGRVAALGLTSAVLEVGGVGLELQCTPDTLAGLRTGAEATLPTSMVVREDSLTLFGFADDDEKQIFELLQTASGVGPKLAQAMLAVHRPEALRRAVAQRRRQDAHHRARASARRARSGSSSSCATASARPARRPARHAAAEHRARTTGRARCRPGWSGLGWSAKEADRAVAEVAPEAEQMATPDVARLLRAALRTLSKA